MLNLETKNKNEELIKQYLENNANEELITKINNGTQITKENKILLNKKTLNGFMEYANNQAREIAEKGKNYAMIEDEIVYGWAMHYFEEDSIEEKLFNLDGTEYKITKKETTKQTYNNNFHPLRQNPPEIPKKNNPQLNLFDMFNKEENTQKEEEINKNEENDEYTQDEFNEAMEKLNEEEIINKNKEITTSPLYTKYIQIQEKYPKNVIIERLGDFYEVFGENAIKVAKILDLTLTSREVGLEKKIEMAGFPYHLADIYISKLIENNLTITKVESENEIQEIKPKETKNWINSTTYADEDGIIHKTPTTENETENKLKELIGDIFICAN